MVSICIPVYNCEKYIERTLRSAMGQNYEDMEILVIDNCSEDDTIEVVKRLQKEDSRIRLICNDTNIGMLKNWDLCVRSCKGEYIKLIPADDVAYPDCVPVSVRVLEKHPEVTLVCTGTDIINSDDKKIGKYAHWFFEGTFDGPRISKISLLLNDFYGNPVSFMFRKSDFLKTEGFDPNIPFIPDFDICIQLASLGRVAFVKRTLNAFRVRSDSNTGILVGGKSKKYTEEHKRLVDKHIANGNVKMNGFERWFSITWRFLRTYIIALFIKLKK